MSDVRTIASGLDHPEGVALGPDGLLYACGESGQVYRVDPASGSVEQIARSEGGSMIGLCLAAEGSIYVCDAARAAVLRVDQSGAVETWCEAAGGKPLVCPNWPAFASDGSLYVSDFWPRGSGPRRRTNRPYPARRRRRAARLAATALPERPRCVRRRNA